MYNRSVWKWGIPVYAKLPYQFCLSMIKSPQVLGGQTPSNLSTIEPLGTPDALGSVARWRGAFPAGPEDQWVYDLIGVLQVLQGWICLTCRMSYLVQVLMLSALFYSSLSCYQLLFLLYFYLLQFFRVSTFIHRVPILLLFLLTPPLAALRNLLLFNISEEFTTFQHIRPGVGWGVGWDVNVHLHVHTTWMLRCCYVGHGLGWGGMLTFICTCTPRGCYVAATWGMGWGGVGC